ncbi:MAG: hypothetical protein AAFY56_21040 [Pseudomonadota bacterium]
MTNNSGTPPQNGSASITLDPSPNAPRSNLRTVIYTSLLTILAGIIAIWAQGYFDFVNSRHEIVQSQIEATMVSSSHVEDVMARILAATEVADGQVKSDDVAELRNALIDLSREARLLADQAGELGPELRAYEDAMADLLAAASRTTGPLDARSLWEAAANYHVNKTAFQEKVTAAQRTFGFI